MCNRADKGGIRRVTAAAAEVQGTTAHEANAGRIANSLL